MDICLSHLYAQGGQKKAPDPRIGVRQLQATLWELGNEPRFYKEKSRPFNHRDTSPTPSNIFLQSCLYIVIIFCGKIMSIYA